MNISDLTIRNGKTFGNGAGILNKGVLSLANCVIDHNLPGDASYSTFGGGISNEGGALTITDCVISNNSSGTLGGGVYHGGGSMVATRVTFASNHAGSGGGISAGGNFSLDHSTLVGNQALDSAGGIDNIGTNAFVTSTTLKSNMAPQGGGGGIRNFSSGVLTLAQSSVDSNVAAEGGGITNSGTLNVRESTISSNTATGGGGISNSGVLFVTSSTLSANSAQHDGGGILNLAGGNVNMYNTTVAYNQADSNGDGTWYGGGLNNQPAATLNIRNTVVAGHTLFGSQDYNDCTGVLGMYGNNKFSGTAGCLCAGQPGHGHASRVDLRVGYSAGQRWPDQDRRARAPKRHDRRRNAMRWPEWRRRHPHHRPARSAAYRRREVRHWRIRVRRG